MEKTLLNTLVVDGSERLSESIYSQVWIGNILGK